MTRARAVVERLWRSEPVRTVLAPLILAAVVAALVKAGVEGSVAGIVATVILGALGFTAQEIARARVTPTVNVPDLVKSAAGAAIPGAPADVVAAVGSVVDEVQTRIGRHAR